MNEKIVNLMKELQEECDKESVSILCVVSNFKTGESGLLDRSTFSQRMLLIDVLVEHFKNSAQESACNCPDCLKVKKAMAEIDDDKRGKNNKQRHEFIVNGPEDLFDVLKRIAGGEFK